MDEKVVIQLFKSAKKYSQNTMARGESSPVSDIDLLVLLDPSLDYFHPLNFSLNSPWLMCQRVEQNHCDE